MNPRPSLPEEVFLLACRDDGLISGRHLRYALGGAILAELMVQGRLGVSGSGRKARVVVLDSSATGWALLDRWQEMIRGSKPRRPSTWVAEFSTRKLKHEVAEFLRGRGLVRVGAVRVLFFRRRAYSLTDHRLRREVLERLWGAVSTTGNVDSRTACLAAVADGGKLLSTVFGEKRIRPHKARIKQITEDDPIGAAVRQAVEERTDLAFDVLGNALP